MDMEKIVDDKKLMTKCGWSPFSGRKLKGWPVMTIVVGEIVYAGGRVNDTNGNEVEFS